MTPDKARALLDGTTPGPWVVGGAPDEPPAVVKHRTVDGGPHIACDNIAQEIHNEADATLIVAAPVLAAMIAGMTVEYGVYWPATDDFPAWTSWGFDTIEKAREHNRVMTVPPETPGTILRRYVTTPEAVE